MMTQAFNRCGTDLANTLATLVLNFLVAPQHLQAFGQADVKDLDGLICRQIFLLGGNDRSPQTHLVAYESE